MTITRLLLGAVVFRIVRRRREEGLVFRRMANNQLHPRITKPAEVMLHVRPTHLG